MADVATAPQLNTKGLPTIQRVGVTLTVLVSLTLLMLVLPLGSAGFITEAFAGAAVIFLYLWRDRRDWIATAVLAAFLGGVYNGTGAAVTPWLGWDVCFPAALYGMSSIVVLFYRSTGEDDAERLQMMALIRDIALIPALCLSSIVAVWFDLRLTPRTYDRFLYAFDLSLGFNPSFAMGVVFRAQTALRLTAGLIYSSLPVNLCLLCALWLRRRPKGAPDVRLVFAALGIVGFALYQFCPAAGPIYLFGKGFPYQPPSLANLAMATTALPDVPRNAIPSLHVAWCLLVLYNSWRFPSWLLRSYAVICLVLTAAATLGLGEHYLVDLIVAVPLSVAVQLGCTRRWLGAAVCMAMVVAWLALLRSGIGWQAQPLGSWIAVGIAMMTPALLNRRFRSDRV
jgi:PAP2 superfamily